MPISHVLVETGRSIGRNRTTFLLATSVQAVCFTLLGIFFLVTHNVALVGRAAEKNIELHAFIADDADPDPLVDQLRCITGVAGAEFVSKDQALAELAAELGDDAGIVDALGYNPLPAAIRVSVETGFASAQALHDIETKAALLPSVTEVWSGQESLARLNRLLRTAIWLGTALLVLVSIAVAFIVFQTVDSSITRRRREIEIMELVGASRSVVRAPFVLEGVLQGALGGLAAFAVVLLLARLASWILPVPFVPVPALLALNLTLGCLLGLVGSWLALGHSRQ